MAKGKDAGDFWELLHAALGLQNAACRAADEGHHHDAALYERQAIALLLEATCLLETDQPALTTVRQLAVAGLARLHGLKKQIAAAERQARPTADRPRRKRVATARRAASA